MDTFVFGVGMLSSLWGENISTLYLFFSYILDNCVLSCIQADMKLTEEQLASLSSPRAVNEFLESQRENITNVIKQNLAVADIFKSENLQVGIFSTI